MSEKKRGRPPVDNPLSEKLYLRVDKTTLQALDKCAKKLSTTRSDAARKGIFLLLDELEKN